MIVVAANIVPRSKYTNILRRSVCMGSRIGRGICSLQYEGYIFDGQFPAAFSIFSSFQQLTVNTYSEYILPMIGF